MYLRTRHHFFSSTDPPQFTFCIYFCYTFRLVLFKIFFLFPFFSYYQLLYFKNVVVASQIRFHQKRNKWGKCGRKRYTGPTGRTGPCHDPPDPSAYSTHTALPRLASQLQPTRRSYLASSPVCNLSTTRSPTHLLLHQDYNIHHLRGLEQNRPPRIYYEQDTSQILSAYTGKKARNLVRDRKGIEKPIISCSCTYHKDRPDVLGQVENESLVTEFKKDSTPAIALAHSSPGLGYVITGTFLRCCTADRRHERQGCNLRQQRRRQDRGFLCYIYRRILQQFQALLRHTTFIR